MTQKGRGGRCLGLWPVAHDLPPCGRSQRLRPHSQAPSAQEEAERPTAPPLPAPKGKGTDPALPSRVSPLSADAAASAAVWLRESRAARGGGNSETTGEGATLSAHSPLLHSPPQGTFLVQQHQEDLKGDVPPPSFIP